MDRKARNVMWEMIYKKYDGRYDDLVSAYVDAIEFMIVVKRELNEMKKLINGGKNEKHK